MAQIIDGKAISAIIRKEIAHEVQRLKSETGTVPGLAVVLVGENPASKAYVRSKGKACAEAGMYSEQHDLSADVSETALLDLITTLNRNDKIHGILVQMPLPKHIDEHKVINAIDPNKDVDGFHPVNMGKLLIGEPGFRPCTPLGIQKLLAYSGIETSGKQVVVLGRSNIVGKPIANMLVQKQDGADATVTICHSHTRELATVTSRADILIAAIGRAEAVTATMVKPGAVVIDVGINRVDDASSDKGYRIVGDVKYDEVEPIASAITPVPGGVGPMTIAMLLFNTLQSAKIRAGVLSLCQG